MPQIQRDIFEGATIQAVYRRLSKLISTGLVMKVPYHGEGWFRSGYSAGQKYLERIHKRTEESFRHQALSESIDHDLVLTDIRSCLQRFPVVKSYFTENIIESSEEFERNEALIGLKYARPDAVLEVSLDGKVSHFIPLEYEASLKSKERSKQKIENL